MKCIHCQKEISKSDRFCGSCGVINDQYVSKEEKFCPSCGQVISLQDTYCEFCGALTEVEADYSSKSKYIAGVLAFILGVFGAHDFYLEKPFKGIMKLLLSFLMIGMIIFGSVLFLYSIAKAPEGTFPIGVVFGLLLIIMGSIGIFFIWIFCVYQGFMILTDKNATDKHGKPFK